MLRLDTVIMDEVGNFKKTPGSKMMGTKKKTLFFISDIAGHHFTRVRGVRKSTTRVPLVVRNTPRDTLFVHLSICRQEK